MPRLGKQFESKRCVSGIEAIGSKPAILCSLVALVRYLFIGWETNWMAFNIIKVDRHSGIACQNLQRCLIQIDPRRNGSSTNRESLGNGPNACSPFPNRVLTFYFLKKWKDTWYPFQDLWRSSHSAHSPLRISGNFAVKKTSCFAARTGQLGWAVATAILHQADQKCPRHLKIHGIIWHSPFPLILIMAYIQYPQIESLVQYLICLYFEVAWGM